MRYFYAIASLMMAFSMSAQAAEQPGVVVTEASFKCLSEMIPVRGFFVDNLSGDIDATVKVAQSSVGGVYPPGSVVQLVPTEVMVKRETGFSPVTKDWEFFELDVDRQAVDGLCSGYFFQRTVIGPVAIGFFGLG